MRYWSVGLGVLLMALATGGVSAQVLSAPALGGPEAAFEQVLGGPNDASIGVQYHFQRCAGTDTDQFIILAPNDQVWSIERAACGLSLPLVEQRFADAAQYLPSDAVAGQPFTTESGESAMSYVSSNLADALPAALFHDCAGKAVTPGTLFVVADSYGGWFMAAGACPSE
jgi:hypothetical protein